jgi:hypothetical protein
MEARNALERSRDINVWIKGCLITLAIKDPTQEWDLRLQARIKDAALGQHFGLKPLVHETMLMNLICKDDESVVPDELLVPMRQARQCASDILDGVELSCFSDIQKAHGQYTNNHKHNTPLNITINGVITSALQIPMHQV